jgi:drug/metabolite transporter (DMT)-like permease
MPDPHGLHGTGRSGITAALVAAILFGAGTPLAKYLLGSIDPWMLAGLLYMGSGVGLTILRWLKRGAAAKLSRADMGWLAGATLTGGMLAPVLLMYGLTHLPASVTALLLNAEGVLTALLAWFAFRENFDRRIAIGMALIALGALLLTWPSGSGFGALLPSLMVVAACLAWAIDNNLTRKIALADATLVASIKGLVAGIVNLGLALLLGASLPDLTPAALAMGTGLLTYGVSLVLFVVALRRLGAARTAAYFSVAPFVGAIIGLLSGDSITWQLAAAFILMATGIWLHLTEVHSHEHEHVYGDTRIRHTHHHFPDADHDHSH